MTSSGRGSRVAEEDLPLEVLACALPPFEGGDLFAKLGVVGVGVHKPANEGACGFRIAVGNQFSRELSVNLGAMARLAVPGEGDRLHQFSGIVRHVTTGARQFRALNRRDGGIVEVQIVAETDWGIVSRARQFDPEFGVIGETGDSGGQPLWRAIHRKSLLAGRQELLEVQR